MNSTVLIILIVVIVALVGVVAWLFMQRRQSEQLSEHFGPEYERELSAKGSKREGEAELRERQKRHRDLDIRPLAAAEAERYRASWERVQAEFVDDPAAAVRDADVLVIDIMRHRGYPVDDFDQRAADVSVEHPDVVEHYRKAREIAIAHHEGRADTEDMRQAVTSYRSLVEALLDQRDSPSTHSDRRLTNGARLTSDERVADDRLARDERVPDQPVTEESGVTSRERWES